MCVFCIELWERSWTKLDKEDRDRICVRRTLDEAKSLIGELYLMTGWSEEQWKKISHLYNRIILKEI